MFITVYSLRENRFYTFNTRYISVIQPHAEKPNHSYIQLGRDSMHPFKSYPIREKYTDILKMLDERSNQ